MLLGLANVPCVQTLRTQVASLAERVEPDVVMHKLFEAFVELEPVWEGAYYVDGHPFVVTAAADHCRKAGTRNDVW